MGREMRERREWGIGRERRDRRYIVGERVFQTLYRDHRIIMLTPTVLYYCRASHTHLNVPQWAGIEVPV